MVCYSPLHAFRNGLNKSGKVSYKITSNKVNSVYYDSTIDHWYYSEDKNRYSNNDYIDVPCGCCIGCRLDYSKQWALRCSLESLYHERTMFITLTYDDDHVPRSCFTDSLSGEIKEILTLKPDDWTRFMKRLRRYYKRDFGKELRFYACGEYGSTTLRPHYHAIVFGLDLDDLKQISTSGTGFPIYESEFLSKCWKNGFITVQDSNFDTCAYVARYVVKKRKGKDAQEYEQFNIEPEFVRMSRMPGIGLKYYEEHKHEIYSNDEIILKDGKKFKPPSYFDDLYEKEFPEEFQKILDKRIECAKISDNVKEQLFGDKYKRLNREELAKLASVKKLVREL